MNEIFGWPDSVINLMEENKEGSNLEPDDSDWYNNEDPEAAEESSNNTVPGTAQADTNTGNSLATNEKLGSNEPAGTGESGSTSNSRINNKKSK